MTAGMLLIACLAAFGQTDEPPGVITGAVVNLSRARAPAAGAEVALRTIVDGEHLIVAETVADDQGRFRFAGLPAGDEYTYVAGANRDDVHYPGPRLRLPYRKPQAEVEIGVYDAVSYPSPLVIRRHQVRIRPEPTAIHVAEELVIENPTNVTFVGQPPPGGPEPVTLELSIPSNFERTTFHSEYFGRRFVLIGGKLVTGVPWLPGQKQLKFHYVVPHTDKVYHWRRGVDLPCDVVEVSVENVAPDEVRGNLPLAANQRNRETRFVRGDKSLLRGDVIEVDIGSLPVSLMATARWLALGGLIALIACVGMAIRYRRRKTRSPARAIACSSKEARGKSRRRAA